MKKQPSPIIKIVIWIVAILTLGGLTYLAWYERSNLAGMLALKQSDTPIIPAESASPIPTNISATPSSSPLPKQTNATLATSSIPTLLPTATLNSESQTTFNQQGVIIMSLADGDYFHLFAFHPQFFPLTRLTNDPWDDISPSISPDGTKVVYSSKRSGYWDLYLLDLTNGKTTQLTNTPEYDGSPTWSPDGKWIAYESYVNNNMDIYILSMDDLSKSPAPLTPGTGGVNYSPAWSPQGREIAFVSTRDGNEEIWLAHLDLIDNRFSKLSQSPSRTAQHPAWSPDGRYISWASKGSGVSSLVIFDTQDPKNQTYLLDSGDWAIWDPSGKILLSEIYGPSKDMLSGYFVTDGTMVFPMITLPGIMQGMDWKAGSLTGLISKYNFPPNASVKNVPLWQPVLTLTPPPPEGRFGVVLLEDVTAPFPYLHDKVDESFILLRQKVAKESGWDFLSSLENAFIPITSASIPSLEDNWFYTGRSFAVNPLPMSANWMVIVREDFGGQVFWHMYIKARYQDGSQGYPLLQHPWDLSSRYNGNPKLYEEGGALMDIPQGYWIDFTELASRFGWERLPALVNWRTFYPGIRFNQYILRENLTWEKAMAELYPPELLATPTSAPTLNPEFAASTLTAAPEKTETPTPKSK